MREPWSQYSSRSQVSSTGSALQGSAAFSSPAACASWATSQASLGTGSLYAEAASRVLTRLGWPSLAVRSASKGLPCSLRRTLSLSQTYMCTALH